jgi:hypothetical protein
MSLFCDRPRPICGQPFSQLKFSKATVGTSPAGSKWVLVKAVGRAGVNGPSNRLHYEGGVKGGSDSCIACDQCNKGTIKTRKNSPSPKKRSRSISLSHLTVSS